MASATSGAQPAPEITAEWTVHAQLTLSHQGSSTTCDRPENSGGEPETVSGGGDSAAAGQPSPPQSAGDSAGVGQRPPAPVKLVYKFSTADSVTDGAGSSPNGTAGVTFKQGNAIFTATGGDSAFQPTCEKVNTVGEDSGHTSNNPSSALPNDRPVAANLTTTQLFPKCTSTCSIVLTADLLPNPNGIGEPFFSINKCASTSTADKGTLFPKKNLSGSRVYEAKDVSCQTSDIEAAIDKFVQTSGDNLQSLQKKVTDVQPYREEKYSSLTRKSPLSPANIISPSNTLQSQRSSVKEGRKKPRTVHIDVYCTGSDAESSSSSDESSGGRSASSSSSGSRFDTSHQVELKSGTNVTHPTIYESEEMKVRHKRAGKHEVPRRVLQQTVDQSTLSTIGSLKKAGSQNRKRCSTKEEINESKQILLGRILGESEQIESFPEIGYFRRDPSDDNLSSNYPFSYRSTKRDVTGSSLSSALASAGGDEIGDLEEAAGGIVSLHRSGTFGTHSDSFEYENSEDRFRIYEMERVWGQQSWKSPSVERRLLEIHNPRRRANSESDNNLSESDHSFVFDSPSRPNESNNHSQNEFSDSSPSTVKSCSNRTPSNAAATTFGTHNSRTILQQALLNTLPAPTRVWSPIEGYSSEYLALARRFGSLITGKRKPGVHMGPVRNPECQCEHCRRWVIEREGGLRERALSVDDTPYNIVDMRKKYHLRNRKILP